MTVNWKLKHTCAFVDAGALVPTPGAFDELAHAINGAAVILLGVPDTSVHGYKQRYKERRPTLVRRSME